MANRLRAETATREASSRAAREYAIEMEKLQKENTHLKMSAGGSLAGGSGGRGNYGNPNGGSGAAGGAVVQFKREQRWPTAEEAKDGLACVLCGRYAQYDSRETGDGVCSMECKKDQLEGHAPLPGGRPVNHTHVHHIYVHSFMCILLPGERNLRGVLVERTRTRTYNPVVLQYRRAYLQHPPETSLFWCPCIY